MVNLLDYIGKTSLLKLSKVMDRNHASVWAKMENLNPSGSIKDRIALNIINEAEKKGKISPQRTTVVEATSGNTGIALAMVCSLKGYRLKLFMPATVSNERKQIILAYGAEIVEVDDPADINHAIDMAGQLVSGGDSDIFMLGQFSSKENVSTHRFTTAEEIIDQIPGKVDALVAGVGTGGTISGIGERLKEHNKDIRIYAVEPRESGVLSGGMPGTHTIEGIGVGFIPEALNTEIYDDVICIGSEDAKFFTNEIVRKEGILIGISSGATCLAAKMVAEKMDRSKNVVTIFFDTGERYLSTGLFA